MTEISMQKYKIKKSFAWLSVGFLIMGALMSFDQLYRQALLNVVIAALFGIAYLRTRLDGGEEE